MTAPVAVTQAVERLERSTWDNRVLPSREDVRALLDSHAQLLDALAHLTHDVQDLVANSTGVAGLHMNGDIAPWDSLLPGGAFEAWLGSVEGAEIALFARGDA